MDCVRTCDIRGKYPQEVNEELLERLGRGLAARIEGEPVLVGSDFRTSSPSLKQAFSEGILTGGGRVLDAGTVPTPLIYFGRSRLRTRAAAIITASHNPPDHNGLKLLLGRYPATQCDLRQLLQGSRRTSSRAGRIESVDIRDPYMAHLGIVWGQRLSKVPRLGDIVVDPGGGSWSCLAREALSRIGLHAAAIHDDPDGRFPNRSPDCSAPGSLTSLSAAVRVGRAAVGFAWDGDGDRLAVCDEKGRAISADQLALLLIPDMLREQPRERVLCDLKISNRVREAVLEAEGILVIERSAHCYLERSMIDQDCLFGCELSGHFFFRDLQGADDGLQAALVVLEFLGKHSDSLSELVHRLPPLFVSPDIRVSGGHREFSFVRHRIEGALTSSSVSRLDGLRVDLPDGWFLIRPSVSERKITFRFEGNSRQALESIIDRVATLVGHCVPELLSKLEERKILATN